MNLFSQSKLKLKLNKPNSAFTTATANECQKQDNNNGIDSLKSENPSNNSLISVNDSFVEVLSTPRPQISMSQNLFISSPNQNECSIKNVNKACPVCLLMICSNNFINHVKSCGTSHNVSSEVLIKAIDLQERQIAEREALGLPKVTMNNKKKKNPVKQSKLKIGSDSNLDLAIAMSASLQESKEAEIIRESETLLEAGLEKEAIDKRKTLESFGFISNHPVKSKSKVFKTNSILFKQTKEDREKRITEKVAMILIDSFTDVSSEMLVNCPDKNLRSTFLNKIRNCNNKLWKKSSLEEENNKSEFYVKKLSKFIIPCESNSFADSKDILKFSTHQNVTKKEPNNTSHRVVDNIDFFNISNTSPNIETKTMSEYSFKWKSMVNNPFMSDIIFITEDEFKIHAHILVLHVQCPNILDDIVVEESYSNNSKRMIMWLEYSYESCLAFLEYIYSGQESFVHPEYREDYLHLKRRYNFPMVVDDENHGSFSEMQNYVSKRQCTELNNSQTDSKRYKASSPDMFSSNVSSFNFLGPTVNDEQTLSSMKTKLWLNSCNGNQTYPSSSFTRNLATDVSTILLDTNSNHSFHSASTIWLKTKTQNISDNSDDNIDLDDMHNNSLLPNSTNESSVKTKKTKSIPCSVITKAGMLPSTNSYVLSDVITISDSESENEKQIKNMSTIDKYHRTSEKYNLPINLNNTNIIELNDDSVDSIYSASTNIILNQRNYIQKSQHSLFKDLTTLDSRNRSFINIDDGGSIFSAVTNVLPSNKNLRIIDKVEGGNCLNPNSTYPLNNSQQGGKNGFDYGDLKNFASNTILPQCKDRNVKPNRNNKSTFINTTSCNVIDNEFTILSHDLNKPRIDSNQLKSTITSTNLTLPSNNSDSSSVNTNNFIDLSCSSAQFMNNTTVNTASTEGTPSQSSNYINISTIPNENDYTQNKSIGQIMLENDCKPDNSDIPYVPTENNLVLDETKVQSQKHNYTYDNAINLDIKTPIILNDYNLTNSGEKKAVTPNKYGGKKNTPKSLRRVQSESVIGSNDPVTPLPDYSAMKTPDLKKEFDRYGLKDLGRRKGKLILRHIYNTTHHLNSSEIDNHTNNTQPDQNLDLSDNSECGIPDYDDGSFDEIETLTQTNKVSVEMGFKNMLQVNQDLHKQILCYKPIWIEELKEGLKMYNVNISIQNLMTFLDDKCVTFRSKTLNKQKQKVRSKKTGRKKLF